MLGVNQPHTVPDYVYSFPDEGVDETSSLERIDLADAFQANVGHAFTTTDDDVKATSPAAVINNYLCDLDEVPEEEETTTWYGTTEIGSRPSTSRSLNKEDSTPPGTTSDSTAKEESRESASALQGQTSSFSETLMSPTVPQFYLNLDDSPVSQGGDAKRRQSESKRTAGFAAFSHFWDEDIDYCYEHAAEADCDFDWHRNSLEIPTVAVADASPTTSQTEKTDVNQPMSLSRLRTAASAPGTPDLDPGSAQSASTRSHEAVTPLSEGVTTVDPFAVQTQVSNHGDYFKPVDSDLLSAAMDKDMAQDAMYEEFLAAGEDSDRHFAFYPQSRSQSVDIPVSPRSSCSPISKYNSQESIILSRAASIVRKHRSSTSTASVPELVPSANSSRENTIRESTGSVEQLGPTPDPVRQGPSSYHRQTRSLAPELGSSSNLRATRSSGSINVVDVPSPIASPVHDRTKSVSAVEHEMAHRTQKGEGPPFAVRMQSAPLAQRRKSRASYSLFPASMTSSQRR